MGKNIIIKGADFSANSIVRPKGERLADIFNSRVFHKGLGYRTTTYPSGAIVTNIENMYYTDSYNGDKKISINNGGILLSDFLDVLNVTKITFTPKDGYRYNIAIGNSSTSIVCNGRWSHLTNALTVDFTDFHETDWTEVAGCYFLLCIVQKSTDTEETLTEDFTKYMSFNCE